MSHTSKPIIIAGGGLVGLATALALAPLAQPMILLEQAEPGQSMIDDPRTLAIGAASVALLAELGVILADHNSTAMTQVDVSEQGRFHKTRLRATELGVPLLGRAVSFSQLHQLLLVACQSLPQLSFRYQQPIKQLRYQAGELVLTLAADQQLPCGLLLVCLGARAPLLSQLGVQQRIHDYGQSALLGQVTVSHPQMGLAFERFTPDGAIALLPRGDQQYGLIWTSDSAITEQRNSLAGDDFLPQLQQQFGDWLGRFTAIKQRYCFPLKQVIADQHIKPKSVLLGSAAHHLHPVGGQGFNLALRGINRLRDALLQGQQAGCDLADWSVLSGFAAKHRADWQALAVATDALATGFNQRAHWAKPWRGLGLLALDQCSPAKRWFGYRAMGYRAG